MKNRMVLIIKFFLLFVIFTFLSVSFVNSQQIVKDYLFLLDTSGSMVGEADGRDIFQKVKNSMYNKIDKIPISNAYTTTIILMTFDEGIQSEWSKLITSKSNIQEVKEKIQQLKAKGDVTWITHGLDGSLSKLDELRNQYPHKTHWQYLYMFTDAINTGPGTPPITFEDIKKRFKIEGGEYHRYLYIITLGIPENVQDSLKKKLQTPADTTKVIVVKIISTPPGKEPLIPITLYFETDNKYYLKNKKIKLIVSSDDEIKKLDIEQISATVIKPDKKEQTITLRKADNSFTYSFTETDITGEYKFEINDVKTEDFQIYGEEPLTVKVYSPEIKVEWEKIGRFGKGEKMDIQFFVKAYKLPLKKECKFAIFSEEPNKLQILFNNKKIDKLPIILTPDKNNNAEYSFCLTFQALEKIGWLDIVKFNGEIDDLAKFGGTVTGKTTWVIWLILIFLFLVIIYIICLVFVNKIFSKWEITVSSVNVLLSSHKKFFTTNIVIGRDCFKDYFETPCFKLYGNCIKTLFNKSIYLKAYKNIKVNGEKVNSGDKKEIFSDTEIEYNNKKIEIKQII